MSVVNTSHHHCEAVCNVDQFKDLQSKKEDLGSDFKYIENVSTDWC